MDHLGVMDHFLEHFSLKSRFNFYFSFIIDHSCNDNEDITHLAEVDDGKGEEKAFRLDRQLKKSEVEKCRLRYQD